MGIDYGPGVLSGQSDNYSAVSGNYIKFPVLYLEKAAFSKATRA